MLVRYLFAAGGGLALLLTACDADSPSVEATSNTLNTPTTVTVPTTITTDPVLTHPGPASFDQPPSALLDRENAEFPTALVNLDDLIPGGPGPDGIRSIDEPKYLPVDEIDFLEPQDAVLVLEHGGEARAFPVDILIWHEIVNTELGGDPVTVTYCPLCNSAVTYRRVHPDGTVMDFGTSGLLYNDSLVMYDRQTKTLWTHFDGLAVVGVMAGNRLDLLPMATVSFRDFSRSHPDGLVLSRDTGMQRSYGNNPYLGYDTGGGRELDGITSRTRMILVRGDEAIAVVHQHLFDERVVELTVHGRELVALLERGTATSLQLSDISYGRDVGATGVFVARVNGQPLTFEALLEADDGGFRDIETGSTWDILGNAVAGPLAGSTLEAVEHLDTFWFAVRAFNPDATIIGSQALDDS